MGQPNQEPSMEDILASIKRIIAEDSEAVVARTPRLKKGPVAVPDPDPEPAVEAEADVDAPVMTTGRPELEPDPEPQVHEPSDVLELTSPLVEPYEESVLAAPKPATGAADPVAPILSADAASASRNAFAALSQLQTREAAGLPNTLEGLVGDLLRPMLREWLDANLPAIVERVVEAEVKRVSGRG